MHSDRLEQEIARVVQSVNEWDDRTSPDDYPEHLLITSDELAEILRNFSETILTPASVEGSPLLEWAVSRWNHEVKNRPLVNFHRRSLDDTWRQVIRWAGGDADALVGPAHDALLERLVTRSSGKEA